LDEIAHGQGMAAPKFLSTLYDEALEINGHIPNFASTLRTTCALYLRDRRPLDGEAAELKSKAA
jgi:predicted DNA-binding ribbon-helix-helix protein